MPVFWSQFRSARAAAMASMSLFVASRASAQQAAGVTIEGDRAQPQALSRAAGTATSVIPRERFEQPGVDTAEALREQPGIQIVELGGLGAPATAALRGATSAQTPVYLGPVRINDEVGGASNLADVPAFFVERAEIYRGHAPLFAAGLGVAGALWFEPRRARENDARVGTLLGSYGSRSAYGYAALKNGQRALLAGVELVAADNDYRFYDTNGTYATSADDSTGRLRNADATLSNIWLSGEDRAGTARVRLLYNHARRDQGAPKLALTQSRSARIGFARDLFALSSTMPLRAWNGALELTTTALRAETAIDDPLNELSLGTTRTTTPGERIEQTVSARQELACRLRVNEQVSASLERLRRFEMQEQRLQETLSARRWSLRGGASAELPLVGPLLAEALVSFNGYGTSASDRAALDGGDVSGRAGLIARAQHSELYVSAGRYQRPPSLGELYGVSLLVRGNRKLEAERGELIEAGARYQVLDRGGARVAWVDLATFARFTRDLIAYVPVAQGYLHPDNRDRTRMLGAELSGAVSPLRGIDLEVSLALLDPRDSSPQQKQNDVLPYLSRATASALLSWKHTLGSPLLDEFRVGVRALYRSNRYGNPAGDGVIPEQSVFDLEASATGLFHALTARLRVADLFDAVRYDAVGFPLPKRSVFVSMEAEL